MTTDLETDYVDEVHMKAFTDALNSDDIQDPLEPTSPQTATMPATPIRKVSALSDFAPVNLRVKRKRSSAVHSKRQNDWQFRLLRWPLLSLILLFVALEFGLYIIIRQLVNTKEYISAWRGKRGVLRRQLRSSRSYQEWKATANELDEYLGFNDWKKVDEDPYYDWKLIRKVRRSLKNFRERKDARALLGVLETCTRTNFAAVENSRLYSETFFGSKDLIESYYNEQEKSLEFIRTSDDLTNDEKRRFFKNANTNLGTSALCLSGGASFGYYHCGVVKGLLDMDLIPRVVSGTSAGGLIAALVCTRTDEELKVLLVPELANRITACEEPFIDWFKRFRKTGARFDSVEWAKKATFFTRGSLTFKEAYLRTGRILNISVIPADQHSPTKLLNYLTAPNTLIWSALLASAAVPGILNPVVLMEKRSDGSIIPWSWGSRFKDGSLRVDIPIKALSLYFNASRPIVSQVNPHVHLFFFAPRGSAGKPTQRKAKGWRGNFVLAAAEAWLKLELTKNFKVVRDLELLPELLGQDWSSVFLQRFEGAITIWPRTQLRDWFRILTDPDPPELERMIKTGQLVTWPKLHMIENRSRIEKQIFLGRQAVRKSLSKTRPKTPGLRNLPDPSASDRGSDRPMSVDTDAETAFSNGARWMFRRGHRDQTLSIAVTSRDVPIKDPLRSPAVRRKWASELLHANNNTAGSAPPRSSGFFANVRSPSLPVNNDIWSSDSSSEEELSVDDHRHLHHPSVLDLHDAYREDNHNTTDSSGEGDNGYFGPDEEVMAQD